MKKQRLFLTKCPKCHQAVDKPFSIEGRCPNCGYEHVESFESHPCDKEDQFEDCACCPSFDECFRSELENDMYGDNQEEEEEANLEQS